MYGELAIIEKISFSLDLTEYLENSSKNSKNLDFPGQYGDMVYFCSGRGTYHLMKLYSMPAGAGLMPRKRLEMAGRASGTKRKV